jgi:hypothetical protein
MVSENVVVLCLDKNTASTFRRGSRVGFVLAGSNERVDLASDSHQARSYYDKT